MTAPRLPALRAIVLAGERPGGNALARALGLEAGVLAEVAGRSCLERVLDALRASRSVEGGLLVGPRREVRDSSPAIASLLATGDYAWRAPATGPAASAVAAMAECDSFPLLLTTGDHALLTPGLVDDFCARAAQVPADVVVGLVAWTRVRAAWPESRRTLLRFADGTCCGSNLFLLRTPRAAGPLDYWRAIESERKHPWRIARHLGVATLARYVAGTLTRDAALTLLSRRAGATVGHVMLDDPSAAVDVDTCADLALAERILVARESARQ